MYLTSVLQWYLNCGLWSVKYTLVESRVCEHIHGNMPPYDKSIEIKYAHMIAKGSTAKHTLGAPQLFMDTCTSSNSQRYLFHSFEGRL